jgi:hypothetical protein
MTAPTAAPKLTANEKRVYEIAKAKQGRFMPGVVCFGLAARSGDEGAFLPAKSLAKLVELGLGERTENGWVRVF